MYMLLTGGGHPLIDSQPDRSVAKIRTVAEDTEFTKRLSESKGFSLPPTCSQLANSLFKKLTSFNSLERYKAIEALNHPWITRRKEDPIPQTMIDKICTLQQEQKLRRAITLFVTSAALAGKKPEPEYRETCDKFSQKIDRWKEKIQASNRGSFLKDSDFFSNIQSPCKIGSSDSETESIEIRTP